MANSGAFAAIREDGSVVVWGDSGYVGDLSAVRDRLTWGVTSIVGLSYDVQSAGGFAVITESGSAFSWGRVSSYGIPLIPN